MKGYSSDLSALFSERGSALIELALLGVFVGVIAAHFIASGVYNKLANDTEVAYASIHTTTANTPLQAFDSNGDLNTAPQSFAAPLSTVYNNITQNNPALSICLSVSLCSNATVTVEDMPSGCSKGITPLPCRWRLTQLCEGDLGLVVGQGFGTSFDKSGLPSNRAGLCATIENSSNIVLPPLASSNNT